MQNQGFEIEIVAEGENFDARNAVMNEIVAVLRKHTVRGQDAIDALGNVTGILIATAPRHLHAELLERNRVMVRTATEIHLKPEGSA